MEIETSNLVDKMRVASASSWMANYPRKGSGYCLGHVNHLNFGGHQPPATISLERLQVELSRRSSHVLSSVILAEKSLYCDKLMTVIGHQFITRQQFITLTVDICAQDGGREAPRCAGLSVVAETCYE